MAVVALVLAAVSRESRAACKPCNADEFLSGEDDDFCYCTKLADRHALSAATEAIERAARSPMCVGRNACNLFVARIGELRNVPYFRDINYPDKSANSVGGSDEDRRANDIYRFVSRAIKSSASGWRQVDPDEAQDLANRGKFVLGVARSKEPGEPGHVVVVAPAQMQRRGPGSGPLVRDAQNPAVSVRASARFGGTVTTPLWVVWAHDTE